MLELYHGGPAGHSASVLITLAEKGIEYVSHRLDIASFEQHGEAFRSLNPAGQVPVLVADGQPLTETFLILLYLDERYLGVPLGGADARDRYAVQKWGKYVETHIAPNLAIARWARFGTRVNDEIRKGLTRLPPERETLWRSALDGFSEEAVETARAALAKAASRLAEDLADGNWLAGADYTLADIAAYPHLTQFAALDIEVPGDVEGWLDRIAERPAVRAVGNQAQIAATMGPERGRWG
ncbi:MAG: glutathione S-transferase family protein [Porphyrobacter sp.]|nr:glutathione S-transferase family protein [Porphyrobacter sp.]